MGKFCVMLFIYLLITD